MYNVQSSILLIFKIVLRRAMVAYPKRYTSYDRLPGNYYNNKSAIQACEQKNQYLLPKQIQYMKRIQSFRHAVSGILRFLRNETNGQIQFAAAGVAIGLGLLFQISKMEWLITILCITGVLTLEMVNTAIEKLCDVVHSDYHPKIKVVKDMAAGAVLLAATGAGFIGAIIFIPKLILFFQG